MKNYISYNRTIPTVNFDSKELELFMMDFMLENLGKYGDVNEYLGLVMLRLGFKPEDKILLKDVYRNDNKNSFRCVVNQEDYYDIKFENVGNKKLHTRITLIDYNEDVTYECFPLNVSELGVRIIPVKEEVMFADGVSYTRELSNDRAKFELVFEDYKFALELVKPKELELPMYDSNGNYSRYRLDNEDKLRNYLLDFFPILTKGDIVDLYKKVCQISLGSDVSKYPELSLKFTFFDKVTDLVHLKNGELERFGITLPKMGRTLFLNKDGSWSYEINDREGLFNIIMNVDGNKTNYNISIENNSDVDMISEIIQSDTEEARRGIVRVREQVREVFNKKNGSN